MEQILEKQSEKKHTHHEETPLEFIASICSVLVLGLFALTFIFQNFVIPSGSMEKTLLIGDHVLVDRTNLAPPAHWAPFVRYRTVHRGDIIVFLKPGYPDTIYAALWQTRRPPWSVYPPSNGPGTGLYVSHDNGVHWSQITGNGFPAHPARMGIALSPAQPSPV